MGQTTRLYGGAVLVGAFLFFVFGYGTAVFPNQFFYRMIPTNALDYAFLALTSLLLGLYLSVMLLERQSDKTCDLSAGAGGILGFFGVSCVVCNPLIILLMGSTAALAYLEPLRPILGGLGIVLISWALWRKRTSFWTSFS